MNRLLALTALPLALAATGIIDPLAGLPADLVGVVSLALAGVPVGLGLIWIGRWSRG